MATGIATDLAKGMASNLIAGVIQQIKNVVHLDERLQLLKTNFSSMEPLLQQIDQRFQEQQKRLPEDIAVRLTGMRDHLREGEQLIIRANRQRRRCFGCCLVSNPNLFTQITDWEVRFNQVFQGLESVVSISANILQIVSAAAPQAELRQTVPDSGFVGSTIESAQKRLQEWVSQPHPQARMIGVYGMGGAGKTSLLQLVYNYFKEERGVFDVVIWVTVSANCPIEKLQASIAETLKMDSQKFSDTDRLKMALSASLVKNKFILILDDIWRQIDLDKVGVKFGDQYSKVLMSSRRKDVIGTMGASDDYTLRIQPLSTEDGWKLFESIAFTNEAVPKENIQAIAREIALECQGLPLALKTVAAAMRPKKTEDEWSGALTMMRNVDPSFRAVHDNIDADLYQRLRWSYDDLADPGLKICFLYCAVFPEDAETDVETLVEMWTAEKLVTGMVAGHLYIDALVSRGLFEYAAANARGEQIKLRNGQRRFLCPKKAVKVHDVLRDLAIDIGRREEKWLFGTDQRLRSFPSEDEIRDCKRISVGHNDIQDLPTDPICSQLVSLVLANNEKIREVPEGFFSTAMSLKVLDVSGTLISSLPTSLGKLGKIELLNLSGCYLLEKLPENTGNLSSLRFLNLQYCQSLNSLPDSIGGLRNLEHFNLQRCESLMGIPEGIFSHLTSLKKLMLPWYSAHNGAHSDCAMRVKDLANLSNLIELSAVVKPEIKEGTMTTWTEMRRLSLWIYRDRDDVVEDTLPLQMENMNKLESFRLHGFQGVSLPDCISQFQNLRDLRLDGCTQLRPLPACEIGNEIAGAGFPMLKKLTLECLKNLESMVTSEETMSEVEEINISECRSFKRLGTKKLPALKNLDISYCDEFEALEIGSGGLPMLEELRLVSLKKFELTVGPSGVINDGVMPKLQQLMIYRCPLKTVEKLSNLRYLSISHCDWLVEIGRGGFPMLERLYLGGCKYFESMADVWNEETMPKLQVLEIRRCPLLRRLPRGMEKLSNLKEIKGELEWWQNIIWDDDNVKMKLSPLFRMVPSY